MNKLARIAVLLCSCAIACNSEDTGLPEMWPRAVLPRLTSMDWGPCKGPECGRRVKPSDEPCPDIIDTHAEALKVLAFRPECTDAAIGALRTFGPGALSDIAAAYYLRASREHRKSDLLQALEEAEHAVDTLRRDPAARFNLALIQEELGLDDLAVASWNEFLTLDGAEEWAKDVRPRLARLQAPDATAQWTANRTKSIAKFPTAALDYFEKVVLPQNDPATANLFASQLSARLNGDRYVLDAAAAMGRAHEGHVAFATAATADEYHKAAELLKRADSPMHIVAMMKGAESIAIFDNARAFKMLEPLPTEARRRGYKHLLARIEAARAYVRFAGSQYLQSLDDYESALKTFSDFRDGEMIASIRRSQCSTYRTLGDAEQAWEEALRATRDAPSLVVDTRRREILLKEAADTALALGYPDAALYYADAIFPVLQRYFSSLDPADLAALNSFKRWKASAHQTRAKIELQRDRDEEARYDIDEAFRIADELPTDTKDALKIRHALKVRLYDAQGQLLLRRNGDLASKAFSDALASIEGAELKTLRAWLYTQRAEAERRAGRSPEPDLQNALKTLREEESQLLEGRSRGEGEQYWTQYFARFDAYERLVRQSMESGAWQKAFDYHERSRAYEPLDLILKLGTTPREFRTLVPNREPMSLAAVTAQIPQGTALLQYAVHGDRTYTWILTHGAAAFVRQPVPRKTVQRWSEELHRSVETHDQNQLSVTLKAAYDRLMAEPVAKARKLTPSLERLVIIPDSAMHGLPLAALYDTRTGKYLIEEAPIEIAGSATLYVFSLLRDRAMPATRPAALLIGDPAFDPHSPLARDLERLPAAREEVEQIRTIYAPRADVAVRTEDDATIDAFLSLAQDKTIIHFGGHSIPNPRSPQYSLLFLAKSNGQSGAVTAEELIRKLKLDRTRLVVLAACSSAGGTSVGPEGVAPLVRPLITAGVPAVVGSLWDVEDATTRTLAVSFHRRYERGEDAAKALQGAQVDMLRSGDRLQQLVLSWAPFQVIGHASSPFHATH